MRGVALLGSQARKAGKKRKVNAADLEALNRELADIMQVRGRYV